MTGSRRHGFSRGRSTATASASTWRGSFSRRFVPATSWSWTISAATEAKLSVIRSAGAKLFFLPKYSPDLNPIEQDFAKLKHFLRKAAARTIDAVCLTIGEVLQLFTPEECLSYLANAGYGRT